MGITNQAILDNAATTYRNAFDEIFENGPPGFFDTFTEIIPTDSKTNEIDVLESMPQVREWVDGKVFRDVFASSLTATVKTYEKSMAFKRLDVISDRTGKIARRLRAFLSAGGSGGSIYDFLATAALVANGTGYDGVALFSASHPRGPAGATQSNTGTNALSFAEHNAILEAGASLRDAEGEPIGIAYNVLMVGPKNMKIAKEITQSTERILPVSAAGVEATASVVAAAGIPNVFGGGDMTLVVNPRLVGTYDDYYYYFDTSKGPRPVLGYEMTAPHPEEQFSMDDHGRFHDDTLAASVECDVVFAPGDWHVAYAGIL